MENIDIKKQIMIELLDRYEQLSHVDGLSKPILEIYIWKREDELRAMLSKRC